MRYRFLVFGAGAIGTYIGGSLSLQGHEVVFLERQKDLSALQVRGLRMTVEGAEYHIATPHFISSLDEIQNYQFDLAILALKTYHLDEILPDLIRFNDILPPLLCLQNGVNSEKKLADHLGNDLVISGTVTTAVDRNKKGVINVRRLRGMAITNTHPLSQKLLPVFNKAGLNLKICPHPKSMKWSKLLINLMGNASSAILNMDPAEIYADKSLYNLELRQLQETLGVMKLMKAKPINLPGVPIKLFAFTIQYLPQQLSQPLISKVIGGGRGGKMPSFHIDLYSGRGKSEVDQLNGAVVRTGIAVSYPTPVNELLTNVLNDLIQGKEPLNKYANKPEALFARLANI